MKTSIHRRPLRGFLLIAFAATLAGPSFAVRVGGAAAPSASAVQGLAPQPAHVQNDESASLRQGAITALDASGTRLQVQGIWLDLVDGKTLAMRKGKPVDIATLKVGETIRFTVAPGSTEAASLRLIYAP
jgi:hypothetical protein